MPYLGKGLPTTNLEAIRLLAHSFLYEIDEVLKQKTDDNFTRWMDDFTIGVDDRKEAIETINAISDMLKSRGLALNLAKTDIYDHAKAEFHLQIKENMFFDSLVQLKKGDIEYNKLTTELKKRFKKHIKDTSPKRWDKVSKRYITAFKKAKSPKLLTEIEDTYLEYPSLRPSLLSYLAELGYSKKATEKLESILNQIDIFDDISLYQICHLLTLWNIPTDSACLELIARLDQKITSISSYKRSRALCFYSCLWFKAKYNHPEDLANFIDEYADIWHTDTFLRRQTTAILSRLMVTRKEQAEPLLKSQISSGIPNTVTIANQILEFKNIKSIDNKLSWYLFPKVKQAAYPLPKFLVLCSVLNSKNIRTSDEVKKQISEHINDHHYKKWLNLQYNIQF